MYDYYPLIELGRQAVQFEYYQPINLQQPQNLEQTDPNSFVVEKSYYYLLFYLLNHKKNSKYAQNSLAKMQNRP